MDIHVSYSFRLISYMHSIPWAKLKQLFLTTGVLLATSKLEQIRSTVQVCKCKRNATHEEWNATADRNG